GVPETSSGRVRNSPMRQRRIVLLLLCSFASVAIFAAVPTAMPSKIPIPPAAQASAHFDANAATDAYLALIPPAAKARSDAYFEGGYWLTLWDFLYGAVIALLLLNCRWSGKMRDLADRMSRFKPLRTTIYWVEY